MSIRPTASCIVLSTAVFAAACGGDAGGGNDPDLLIGTWRELPNGLNIDDPVESRDQIVLTADGMYQVIEESGNETGTFTADDRDMTITQGAESIRLQYVVTEDRLMAGALTPDGDVDGLIGTWTGEAQRTSQGITEEISLVVELRDDGTARYERDSSDPTGDGDETLDGTWRQDPLDFVMTFEIPTENGSITANLHFQELPGRAIGGPFYERL